MKKTKYTLLLSIIIFNFHIAFSQKQYEEKIEEIAIDLATQIPVGKKIAVVDFRQIGDRNSDCITALSQLITEDLSAELALKSERNSKYNVVDRKTIIMLLKENNILSTNISAISRTLRDKLRADILVTGTISIFPDKYKVTIKLLDINKGELYGMTKSEIIITESLEAYRNIRIDCRKDTVISNKIKVSITPQFTALSSNIHSRNPNSVLGLDTVVFRSRLGFSSGLNFQFFGSSKHTSFIVGIAYLNYGYHYKERTSNLPYIQVIRAIEIPVGFRWETGHNKKMGIPSFYFETGIVPILNIETLFNRRYSTFSASKNRYLHDVKNKMQNINHFQTNYLIKLGVKGGNENITANLGLFMNKALTDLTPNGEKLDYWGIYLGIIIPKL